MTSRELLIVGGGILLAIFLVPFGGPQAPIVVLFIAALVVWDIASGRRKAEKRRAAEAARPPATD